MWILIDTSNGDALEIKTASKLYWWQFDSYADAVRHQNESEARLAGPFEVSEAAAPDARGTYMQAERR